MFKEASSTQDVRTGAYPAPPLRDIDLDGFRVAGCAGLVERDLEEEEDEDVSCFLVLSDERFEAFRRLPSMSSSSSSSSSPSSSALRLLPLLPPLRRRDDLLLAVLGESPCRERYTHVPINMSSATTHAIAPSSIPRPSGLMLAK